MGLPVIATDVRGNRQAVRDRDTGRLVPVRDPTALATVISALAVDDDARRKWGRSARRLALQEFDQAEVIERTIAAYRTLK